MNTQFTLLVWLFLVSSSLAQEFQQQKNTTVNNLYRQKIPQERGVMKLINKNCTVSTDCGKKGVFCNESSGHCYLIGGSASGKKWERNGSFKTCTGKVPGECPAIPGDKRDYYCALTGASGGQCMSYTLFKKVDKVINKIILWSAVACAVIGIISATLALIFFLSYRSRNLCDKYKPKKGGKKRKSEMSTTSVATTDAETK